jgi:hypothetical protein
LLLISGLFTVDLVAAGEVLESSGTFDIWKREALREGAGVGSWEGDGGTCNAAGACCWV